MYLINCLCFKDFATLQYHWIIVGFWSSQYRPLMFAWQKRNTEFTSQDWNYLVDEEWWRKCLVSWQALNGRVGEETKALETLLQRWKAFTKAVSEMDAALKQQEERIRPFDGPIGQEASIKEALRICQVH